MNQKENQNQIVPQQETEVKVETELQPDDWLCLMCSKKITTEKDRFPYKEQTEFQFKNPQGYVFDIITFGEADGCREIGNPTKEFTWFPGHSWSFAVCNRCGLHLGWKYSGKFSFYGLIKARIVKGQALFN
jgi:hypothetical protein